MESANLVTGPLTVKKNNAFNCTFPSTLAFDQDLGIFKVIQDNGNIWTTFTPSQVTALTGTITGLAFKTHWLHVNVKYPNGDEYAFSYKTGGLQQVENSKKWFDYAVKKDAALNEVIMMMKTREKVQLSEVSSVLAKHGMPSGDNDSRKVVEYGISVRKIEGVLGDTQFVSKYALDREQVRYEIVSKFEVSKDGAVILKCPSCGASLPLQAKESSGVCKYCGSPYTVPRNILGLL